MGVKEEIRMLRTKEGEVTSDKKLMADSMESATTAPHGQLEVMGSDNLHVRCRSKNYYYYYYYY
ncbi:hypothetical protein BpHYR1_006658 [Brachionus plicatilis]|uniref:Uncharacterized protein n=1 Tax=Brachionus plicatilis TaxID=10195 RepID=A0A3M7R1U1_BRAPC|nr:hypothetical protein BpHYR1_006658 [Brachionus plicatilis]